MIGLIVLMQKYMGWRLLQQNKVEENLVQADCACKFVSIVLSVYFLVRYFNEHTVVGWAVIAGSIWGIGCPL